VKIFAPLVPVLALAACGQEPAPEPVETPTVAPASINTLPAPDQALFSEIFAETCEGAEPVSQAVCRRALGAETVSCEFGLGEDEYLRHDATLAKNEDDTGWMLDNAEALCAEHGAHHVDN
jgi:hypothetical protein